MQIIAIEGVDGSGKSSVCEYLKSSLGSKNVEVIKTPTKIFSGLTKQAQAQNQIASFCSYLLANLGVCNSYKDCEWLILDRYILSSLVYHHEFISTIQVDMGLILENLNLIKPTATILLDSNSNLIEKRLDERKETSNHSNQTGELKRLYDYYVDNNIFHPWISNVVRMQSEVPSDFLIIKNKIEQIMQNSARLKAL